MAYTQRHPISLKGGREGCPLHPGAYGTGEPAGPCPPCFSTIYVELFVALVRWSAGTL